MVQAFHREFVVDAPLVAAWDHFASAAEWPSWHADLKRVDVTPPGALGAASVATLYPHKGPATTFRMTVFEPHRHWTWIGRLLWFSLVYDHRFEHVDERHTRITLHIDVGGVGASVFGRIVGAGSTKSLDKAIPKLMAEMGRRDG
jgi:Polyketide cyclase / dehydrase and lipid transport